MGVAIRFDGLYSEDVTGDVLVLALSVWGIVGLLEAGESGEVVEECLVHLGVVDLYFCTALPHL